MSETRIVPALSATTDVPAVAVEVPQVSEPAAAPAPTPAVAPVPVAPTASPQSTLDAAHPVNIRMGQLAQLRRESDARAERFEKTAENLKTQLETALAALQRAAVAAPPAPTTSTVEARPTRTAFADDASYEAALVTWAGSEAASRAAAELRQQQSELEQQRQQRQEQEAAARAEEESRRAEDERNASLRTAWETRRAAAIVSHPDFVEVAEAPNIPVTDPMAYMIATRDDGPEIAYYLGKNPGEASRIAALTMPGQFFPVGHPRAGLPMPNAVEQAFEMGKIAARLSSATASPSVEVLPAPANPISGGTAAALRKTADQETMEEYAARRNGELMAARRPGGVLLPR